MTLSTPAHTSIKPQIDPATRLGYVHLTVNNLDRQISFYTQVLGFQLHWRKDSEAALGTQSEILLRLSEDPKAQRFQRTTGMYHFAVLYPSRKELARVIARLFALHYPNSPTDHFLSKVTYLDDPEGNTIELHLRTLAGGSIRVVDGQLIARYADGRPASGRDPLDVKALLRELDESDHLDLPLPNGARIGHVHLYASSLDDSLDFYARILGFQEGPQIAAMRMGEVGIDDLQPHVVAFNTWKGPNLPPTPNNTLGMQYFTIVYPSKEELDRVIDRVRAAGLPIETIPDGFLVRDPSKIKLILTEHMPEIQ